MTASAGEDCRLAILASHPIQYFTPVYQRLASTPGLDAEVWYCRDFGVRPRFDQQFNRSVQWDTDQLTGYRHRFLWNVSPVTNTFNPLHAVNPGALVRMLRGYHALWVNGYLYPSNWLAAAAASVTGARLLMRSELRPGGRSSGMRGAVRDALRRRWIARSHALLYIGELNRRAYVAYGASEEKLFFTPYSVDVEGIAATVARHAADRRSLRAEWSVPADPVVALFVGKLTPRKHPEAMLRLAATFPQLHVVVAGSGPLERELVAEARRSGTANISFLGFVNQSRLAEVYALADIFVMPSQEEPWGLVLNEAMAASLPSVVCSDVGAAADLIVEGQTGFSFDPGDWTALQSFVRRLADDAALRQRVGEAARSRSFLYSYDATASGVVAALSALGLLQPGTSSIPSVGASVS